MKRSERRISSERGVGLPVAIAMLAILLLIAAVAAAASLSVSESVSRDARTKASLAAADAGIASAMFRINSLGVTLHGSTPCVVNTAGGSLSNNAPALQLQASVTVNGEAWCPLSGPETLGNGQRFTYRVTPPRLGAAADLDGLPNATHDRKIVSVGTSAGSSRRVLQAVASVNVSEMFKDLAAIAGSSLALRDSARIGSAGSPASVRSDGAISLGNTSRVCGNATPGPGAAVSLTGSGSVCPGFSTRPAAYTLSVPSPSAAGSSNAVLATLCTITCPLGVSYSASTRSLTVSGALAVLTLPAGTFLNLCNLTVANGGKILAAGTGATAATAVRLFIDSPANCGGSSNLTVSGTGTIQNALLDPGGVQIQSAGAGAALAFSNSAGSPPLRLTVLAPDAAVTLAGSTQIVGGVAGRTVDLSSNASIATSTYLSSILGDLTPLYRRVSYVECSRTVPGASPDSGC